MIKHSRRVEGLDEDGVDIVGTGGDGANTVNISTGASILAARNPQGSRGQSDTRSSVLFVPLLIAIGEEKTLWDQKKIHVAPPSSKTIQDTKAIEIEPKPDLAPEENPEIRTSCFSEISNNPEVGEDYTILQALLSTDMVILFIATFCRLDMDVLAILREDYTFGHPYRHRSP
ncbi:hypothetical protein U1Q18_044476 [Sarracenia purpurea var. burkii]